MRVAILGAGTMGIGITQVCALAGDTTALYDIEADIVEAGIDRIDEDLTEGVDRGKVETEEKRAALERLSGTTDLEEAVRDADLVVEAIPEKLELKRETFREVEAAAPTDAVFATNTSSLSVTAIASALERPDRFLGMHFFNPAHIMPLVEVVVGERTADGTVEFAEEYADRIEKTPIVVDDSPGFASSRLGVALGTEAVRMVERGVASPEAIDTAMELGYNHPVGPLELADMVGLDVRLDVLEYLREELGERFRPPQLLKQKVRAGKLGKKTGEGFYVWEDGEAVESAVDTDAP